MGLKNWVFMIVWVWLVICLVMEIFKYMVLFWKEWEKLIFLRCVFVLVIGGRKVLVFSLFVESFSD